MIENPHLGDAVVFRIGPEFEHRICPVEGDVFRTAFAGWFYATPDFDELFLRNAHRQATTTVRSTSSHQ
jgi:hypothetical protein